MSILEHRWGVSKVADRVWAQVNGLAPHVAGKRRLMVWQAYMDESFDDQIMVIGGCLASAESWSAFAREWSELLPGFGTLGKGGYHFKMSEMAAFPERMARVRAFYRVIEKYVAGAISLTVPLADFEAGKARLLILDEHGQRVGMTGPWFDNAYAFALVRIMDTFHGHYGKSVQRFGIPPAEKVDFIFDERMEKKLVVSSWDEFLGGLDAEVQTNYGAMPRFERDTEFLPLQAADFWAWWVREWEEAEPTHPNPRFPWAIHKTMLATTYRYSADTIFETFKFNIEKSYPGFRVFDLANFSS